MFHQRVCWQVFKKRRERRRKEKRDKEKEGRARKNALKNPLIKAKVFLLSFKILKRSFHQWSIVESNIHPFSFLPLVLSTILTTHAHLDLIV
jgi:hypothetical protein